ncbi:hypothetical protein IKF15_03255 [Candidatus Saccharibacteria bacterium]|nr:hypothetical protein [Candidatus Saccharibacteria bacterium]
MTAQIEVSVKVYLYEQVSNSAKDTYHNEVINYANVYPTWEQAERALKMDENKEVEDGIAYETVLGKTYQYHVEYTNGAGEHVWEIRHERIVKNSQGCQTIEYDTMRVIEKKF